MLVEVLQEAVEQGGRRAHDALQALRGQAERERSAREQALWELLGMQEQGAGMGQELAASKKREEELERAVREASEANEQRKRQVRF